jgi:hypothetical protein
MVVIARIIRTGREYQDRQNSERSRQAQAASDATRHAEHPQWHSAGSWTAALSHQPSAG